MYQRLTLAAGVAVEFQERADFLRILESSTSDLALIFYRAGVEVARTFYVGEGYSEKIPQGFDRVRMQSAAGSVVDFVLRLGSVVDYSKSPTGTTTLSNVSGAFSQAAATVTNASALLVAANPNRRYLLIQNKDLAGSIYLNLAGAAATVANGVRIGPGDSYEMGGWYASTGAVYAIGDIASNANIVNVEG